MTGPKYIPRLIHSRVSEALTDTRIVVIQGARQVGKSTLAAAVTADSGGVAVTLDDPITRDFAASDPTGFVDQAPNSTLVIDEIQRVPELVIALKSAVDRNGRPGRFLVTGSADLLALSTTQESLAGRAERIGMRPFSQREWAHRTGSFIDTAFSGNLLRDHESTMDRAGYLHLACAGGYPKALQRTTARRREDWYIAYIDQIVKRDAADVSGLQRLADLPRLLRLIAARMGSTMVWSSLATDAAIPRRTLDPYVALLETLYLIDVIPAWSLNVTARQVKQPKVFPSDSGIAAALLGTSAAALGPMSPLAGPMLECFVVSEILRQLGWADQRATAHHYRDSRGQEVDLVLETPDGRVVAIEVKAAATVQGRDTAGLSLLRDRLGDRFVAGFIAYAGQTAVAAGDRVTALPIDALWTR